MAELNKEELLKKLTPLQYHVTQEKGTERLVILKTPTKNVNTLTSCQHDALFGETRQG